jgi:hypothetical protein
MSGFPRKTAEEERFSHVWHVKVRDGWCKMWQKVTQTGTDVSDA